ncbi:MAG: glycoside hydrolase family 127 protein [Gemmataceae bacterium]
MMMHTHLPVRLFVAACLLALSGTATADESRASQPLQPVHLQRVKINGFWKQQVKLLTEKWIPHCVRQMEKGGRGQELLNLIEAGRVLRGGEKGEYRGPPWCDAYIHNTVEAICLALEVDPDGDAALAAAQADLRAKLEEWIPIIEAAQEKDGYIHSFHTVKKRKRFTVIGDHELYVMGYLMEAAVAHHKLTGGKDRRLYRVATRCADLLCDTFGPAPKRTWKNGHPGMEYALCRLGVLVNDADGAGKGDRYIALAKHFLDHQHQIQPNGYDQSDRPAVRMTEATGHAVRATYFYTAMADMALLRDDAAYRTAIDRLWANAIGHKYYLTGGVGATAEGEAFGPNDLLPNNGYLEACAGCGLSFWADRMHRLHGRGHYADVQERVLYNNVLGSVGQSGTVFYYQNPLTGRTTRYPWHGCPCCVGNISRALLAIKDLMYSVSAGRDTLFVNQFVDSDGEVANVAGTGVRLRQETRYPWDGAVTVTVRPAAEATFTLAVRIPARAESGLYRVTPDTDGKFTLTVNGQPQTADVKDGYAHIRRTWRAGDRVALTLPLDVQRVRCDNRVAANRGRVAIQRGPIVYNFEDVDHKQPLRQAVLAADVPLKSVWRADLFGGVTTVEGGGFVGVPNYTRLNRGGSSQVWMLEDRARGGLTTLAAQADLTVSYCRDGMDPSAINDLAAPRDRNDHSASNFDFWPHKGTAEWIQYQFTRPAEVKSSTVWWFDDTGRGECRLPASWRLVYRVDR